MRTYIAIDLKSFYASVECMERGLDPLDTNLVVADASRTEKTICLAVSPSLKAYGISGRARLFEVVQKVKQINGKRRLFAPNQHFQGKSVTASTLAKDPSLELDYLIASPRMALYVEHSTQIYRIYLRYVAPEDIHVYSIDEVMIDATSYLRARNLSAHDFARMIIRAIQKETGITAAAGIGTNLYLAKIAMDIEAKHVPPDKDGVRIAELDEMSYRRKLWSHTPLTDFWRIGGGYQRKLHAHDMYTMGDIARRSLEDEKILYDLFGVNAELLIDHAWGWEPCTIPLIKSYRPENNSFTHGQVLPGPYDSEKAKVVVHEMADAASLDLVEKRMVTDQIVLTVGYDISSTQGYKGEITEDRYGRKTPKHAHGTINLEKKTSSSRIIDQAALSLYDEIVDPQLLIRRIYLVVNHVVYEEDIQTVEEYKQIDLFTDYEELRRKQIKESEDLAKERKLQEAMISIKNRFGKNAILKGTNYEDGATGKSRNAQIGGHKA